MAKALVESDIANKPPFAPVASQLQAMADGSTSPTFTELASQYEPMALLLNYMACGCQIAGLDNELSNIVNAYVDHVEGCAEFLSDVGEFAVNAIESGTEALAEGLKVFGNFVGGVLEAGWNFVCFWCDDDKPDCPQNTGITKAGFGVWSTKKIYQKSTGCGNWFCDEGGVLQTKPGSDGKTLYACTVCQGKWWALDSTGTCAPCGGTVKKISSDNMCLLTQTSAPNSSGSACLKGPEQQSCCQPGQKMKPQGKWDGAAPDCSTGVTSGECSNVNAAIAQCKPACGPSQYFDAVTGCTKCDFDSVPVFASADIANDPSRVPDIGGLGPESPSDDMAYRRLFGDL